MKSNKVKKAIGALWLAAVLFVPVWKADACTRALYVGNDGIVITGRSMDWEEDMHTNLWVFPRGMERDGASGANALKWMSKYGSLIATAYDVGSADGMNEKGLVANLLYLAESDYGKPDVRGTTISIATWAQYVLDNFSTVDEAVQALGKELFTIMAPTLPNGSPATAHLSLSDRSGDSAIFEYVKGKLVIHHSREYQVMTNSPTFDEQLALNKYWEKIGGQAMLPGTSRAADRFVRTAFYIAAIPKTSNEQEAVADLLSVMRSVSVPLGIKTPGQPNIASTLWRSIADQKNLIYYFDSATSPNVFWVALADLDFSKGAPAKKLTLDGGKIYAGDAADKFVPAKSFAFLPATAK
jgi:choloylglycine hydrolase